MPKWGNLKISRKSELERLVNDLYQLDKKFKDWGLSKTEVIEALTKLLPLDFRAFTSALYGLYMRKKAPGKTRWGDKNPQYVWHMKMLKDLFPKAQFIHIIRDGRAVYHSFINANRKHGKIYPDTPWSAAVYWKSAVNAPNKFLGNRDYFEIFYEKLVMNPERQLKSICQFLEIDFLPEAMLSFPEANARLNLVPQDKLRWHKATLGEVDQGKALQWQKGLRKHSVFLFELLAGKELERRGYKLVFPLLRTGFLNDIFTRLVSMRSRQ